MSMRIKRFGLCCAGLAAIAAAGCSASVTHDDSGPGWSLADRGGASFSLTSPAAEPRAALSERPRATVDAPAPQPARPAYEYRGGRDAASSKAIAPPDVPVRPVATVATRPVPATPARAMPAPPRGPAAGAPVREAIVVKGDTLHGLSLKHQVSLKALMAANNLTSPKIFPGQKLVIPAATP